MSITDAVREKIKRIREGSGTQLHEILQYGDMDVDVRDDAGTLLFTANLRIGDGGAIMFTQLPGISPPPDADYIPAHIRGYSKQKKKSVHMRGTMVRVEGTLWTSPDLAVTKVVGDRTFFRMQTNAEGTIRPDEGGKSAPCRMRDISVGGVRLSSWTKYAVGDNLILSADLSGDGKKTDLKCRVLRVSGEGPFSYNCEFINLEDETRRKLTRDIFNAQVIGRRLMKG